MPDDYANAFDSRTPLLARVAEDISNDFQESLDDSSISARVTGDVSSLEAFIKEASDETKAYSRPLIEISSQIHIRVEVADALQMKPVECELSKTVSVRSSFWDTEDSRPCLVLVCLIPSQVKCDQWTLLEDAPISFQVHIAVNPVPSNALSTRLQVVDAVDEAPHALVLMGGGVKGLAYAGAMEVLENHHRFNWYVGTSAGAIAAVLLGAGFSATELNQLFTSKDLTDFLDAGPLKRYLNLIHKGGFHHAYALTDWIDELLAAKLNSPTRVRLSDLPNRVTIYASRRDRSALTFDSRDNDADAAYAVRCSMSIPYLFTPQSDQGFRTYDGGIQNNFPVKRFLAEHPGTPFVAIFLGSAIYRPRPRGLVIKDLLSISLEGADLEAVAAYREQTIIVDPSPISFSEFSLTADEKEYLVIAGRLGAMSHLRISDGYAELGQKQQKLRAVVDRIIKKRQRRGRIFWVLLLMVIILLGLYIWC